MSFVTVAESQPVTLSSDATRDQVRWGEIGTHSISTTQTDNTHHR